MSEKVRDYNFFSIHYNRRRWQGSTDLVYYNLVCNFPTYDILPAFQISPREVRSHRTQGAWQFKNHAFTQTPLPGKWPSRPPLVSPHLTPNLPRGLSSAGLHFQFPVAYFITRLITR